MAKNKHNAAVGSVVERDDDRIKSTGEVFTPMSLVYEMIDEIPDEVMIAPVQFHSLAFATFASVIAPFGGFFASGLNRAFKLKDFGDLIPGHGEPVVSGRASG